MPVEITTMSQSSVVPSLNSSPVTLSSPRIARRGFHRWTWTPIFSMMDRQNAARLRVQLLVHQMAAEMDDMDFDAVVDQSPRRFQSEQPAADDGGFAAFGGVAGDLVAVVNRAEDKNAVLVLAVRRLSALPSAARTGGCRSQSAACHRTSSARRR